MKKALIIFFCGMLFATILTVFSGCQKTETKKCAKSDCSVEVTGKGDLLYCSEHRCINPDCENPNIGCIENITNKVAEECWYCRICLYEKTHK